MLPADLAALLLAAGLPTDLEGMLEAAVAGIPGARRLRLQQDSRHGGWWAGNLSIECFGETQEQAAALWLLAAKKEALPHALTPD